MAKLTTISRARPKRNTCPSSSSSRDPQNSNVHHQNPKLSLPSIIRDSDDSESDDSPPDIPENLQILNASNISENTLPKIHAYNITNTKIEVQSRAIEPETTVPMPMTGRYSLRPRSIAGNKRKRSHQSENRGDESSNTRSISTIIGDRDTENTAGFYSNIIQSQEKSIDLERENPDLPPLNIDGLGSVVEGTEIQDEDDSRALKRRKVDLPLPDIEGSNFNTNDKNKGKEREYMTPDDQIREVIIENKIEPLKYQTTSDLDTNPVTADIACDLENKHGPNDEEKNNSNEPSPEENLKHISTSHEVIIVDNSESSSSEDEELDAQAEQNEGPNPAKESKNLKQSRRAKNERTRLEGFHSNLLTMWDDLQNLPKIEGVSMEQPKNISRKLKPFQLQGVAWMKAMEKTKWRGGLLGDEMGMGKTIQAVSLIMSDWPTEQPSLVLVPPVALLQWHQEMNSYTDGTLKTFIYHGTNSKSKGISEEELREYNVILMSYNSLESMYRRQEKGFKRKNCMQKEVSVIHKINFHRVILDEAHSIKSRNSNSAKACFALKANHKWCLSGTPLQNRIGEFFSLIRFLEVKPFTSYMCQQCPCQIDSWNMTGSMKCVNCSHSGMRHISVFNHELLNPIQKFGNYGTGAQALSRLRILTDRIMLRRNKRDHSSAMELPAKEIQVDRQFFGEEENDFAGSIMNNGTRKFETYVSQGVVLNNYANIFGLILQMRQVADHPDLILKKQGEGGQNVLFCCICDEIAEEAIRSVCRHDFCRECAKNYLKSSENPDCPQCHIKLSIDIEQPDIEQDDAMVKKSSIINRIKMEDWTSSSKIEALVHDLYKLRSKNMSHKSIIFSQFTSMLQLIEWRLRRAGITTVMLDGSMTPAQRQASINHFMKDVDVECFLVSLKAGGVALNLTEASKVFIVDPWWNPAAEWQSADRCHRIGQARPCSITRLCIEDSVESRMVLLQEKKANMINSTINSDDRAMESLTPEDMQFLFRGS